MHDQDISVILCLISLGALVSFAQTSKYLTIGPYSTFLSWLLIPAAVASLWKLGSIYGWWTILIFIVVSMVFGAINAVIAVRVGRTILYSMQPVFGTVFAVSAAAAWIVPQL